VTEKAPRTAPKCGRCPDGRLLERYWPWKPKVALAMKCTLVLWPVAMMLLSKPDFYECDACGHKKGALWA
jgi:hypothetical protein